MLEWMGEDDTNDEIVNFFAILWIMAESSEDVLDDEIIFGTIAEISGSRLTCVVNRVFQSLVSKEISNLRVGSELGSKNLL